MRLLLIGVALALPLLYLFSKSSACVGDTRHLVVGGDRSGGRKWSLSVCPRSLDRSGERPDRRRHGGDGMRRATVRGPRTRWALSGTSSRRGGAEQDPASAQLDCTRMRFARPSWHSLDGRLWAGAGGALHHVRDHARDVARERAGPGSGARALPPARYEPSSAADSTPCRVRPLAPEASGPGAALSTRNRGRARRQVPRAASAGCARARGAGRATRGASGARGSSPG